MIGLEEVHVLGVGRLSRPAIERVASEHPGVRFTAFSRAPERHAPFRAANARLVGVECARPSTAPLLICIASDEAAILQARGSTERMAVAEANIALVLPLLKHLGCRDRPVFVVTNPVELVCEAVARATDARRVYGFGMSGDHERLAEALCQGFGLPKATAEAVQLTGLHMLRPIPCLDGMGPGIREHVEAQRAGQIHARLLTFASPWSHAPSLVASLFEGGAPAGASSVHERVMSVAAAITRSEFNGAAPPRARGAARLTDFLRGLVRGERLRVSGRGPDWTPAYAGGWLAADEQAVQLPVVSGAEAELLRQDVNRFRVLARTVLG